MTLPKLLVVSLGGTITMTRSGAGGIAPTLGAADLVAAVPGIEGIAELQTLSPMRVASPSLKLGDLVAVAALLERRLAAELDGAVLIQGTDTIEESAWLLDLLVRSDKPVVVTGAMRGPDAPGADGPANLLASVVVAASPRAAGRGTLVVLNDEVHAARQVRKSHTMLPSAFTSPQCGPVGWVAEGQVEFHARTPRTAALPAPAEAASGASVPSIASSADSPLPQGSPAPVALLRMLLGDDGRLLPTLASLGYRGAVIEGMGAGHVPADVAPLVGELAARMPVVLASRVHAGPAFTRTYGYPGAEIDLLARGALPGGALGGPKARILLSLLLGRGLDGAALAEAFAAQVGPTD